MLRTRTRTPSTPHPDSGTIRFTVDDGDGGTSAANDAFVTVNRVNDPPAIGLPGGPVSYVENDPPAVIDPAATVSDPDSADFNTGTLTVSFTAGGTAHDRLAVHNQGTGPGQVGVSGSNVTYGGTVIGTFSGGTNGATPLVITFGCGRRPGSRPGGLAECHLRKRFARSSDFPPHRTLRPHGRRRWHQQHRNGNDQRDRG